MSKLYEVTFNVSASREEMMRERVVPGQNLTIMADNYDVFDGYYRFFDNDIEIASVPSHVVVSVVEKGHKA